MRAAMLLIASIAAGMAGCGQRTVPEPEAPEPIRSSPGVESPAIALTRFPAKAQPGEMFECAGTIAIPASMESRHSPRLSILRGGVTYNEVRITEVESTGEGPATFKVNVPAPDKAGLCDLVASLPVVPRADTVQNPDRARDVEEILVASPRYPVEVTEP